MVALGLLVSPMARCDDLVDSPEAREQAVERYFKTFSIDELRTGMVEEFVKQLPSEKRDDFARFMNTEVRWSEIEAAAKKSLARHLTVQEIVAFTEFMEKPEGKSAMAKMKYYMADVIPVAQAEVQRALSSRQQPTSTGK